MYVVTDNTLAILQQNQGEKKRKRHQITYAYINHRENQEHKPVLSERASDCLF